jgi:hypothetical protein
LISAHQRPCAVDDAEIAGTGSWHRIEIDALIEARKTAAMVHGQGQEIGIGDLAWPQQALSHQGGGLSVGISLLGHASKAIDRVVGDHRAARRERPETRHPRPISRDTI